MTSNYQKLEALPVVGPPVVPKSFQFRALMRKNATLQIRQKWTVCCQIAVPLVLVGLLGLMQLFFNLAVKSQSNDDIKTYNRTWLLDRAYQHKYPSMLYSNPDEISNIIGELTVNETKSGMLGTIPQHTYTDGNGTVTYPYFIYQPSRLAVQDSIISTKQLYQSYMQSGQDKDTIPYPDGAFVFTGADLESYTLSFEVMVEEQQAFGFPNSDHDQEQSNSIITLIAYAFQAYAMNQTSTDTMWMLKMPHKNNPLDIDIASLLSGLFYPFALSFLMPVYVNNLVLEKQEKLREFMRMMGLKMSWYWLTTYLFYLALYMIVCLLVVGCSTIMRFAIFTQGSWPAYFMLFFGWGNAQIAMSFLLSTFFSKTRTATIFCYALVVANVIVSLVINSTVYQQRAPGFFYFLYPPFAFYREMLVLGILCGFGVCPTTSDYTINNELAYVWFYLYFEAVFMFLLAGYLDNVLPREFGVPKSPLFCLEGLFSKKEKAQKNIQSASTHEEYTSLIIKEETTEDEAVKDFEEDSDVKRERERVYQGKYPPDAAIVISDLHKEYPSPNGNKIAVQSLCLAIEKGVCFGLLGPNGAGKTTTISILTGLYPPSSGSAIVGGFDIKKDMDHIHRIMGVCPQFDILWDLLSTSETLLFYARLKGVTVDREQETVKASLRQVGLEAFPDRLVKDLSGGMKRRLSVAVSLVADPRIVFLDEPTTGLDPESRRNLWDVLLKVKQGKCMILTTHSMEEAEVLCDTIGIMSKGLMRCLGPQLYLRTKFGQGYTLKINFSEGREEEAIRYINSLVPSATIVEQYGGSCTFQLPKKEVRVSSIFDSLSNNQMDHGITDWGINQTSLEDVFLRIVSQDESDHTQS